MIKGQINGNILWYDNLFEFYFLDEVNFKNIFKY